MIPYNPQTYWPQRFRRQGKNYVARGGRAHLAREQHAAVAPLLRELVKGKTVLDFGCGPQRFRSVLEEGGRAYEGVDLIPGLGTMPLTHGLPAERFDSAVAIWVLQHIVDEAEYRYWVGQLYASLVPGGRLVVVDHLALPDRPMAAHMRPRGMDALLYAAPWDGEGEMVTVYDGHWVGWVEKPTDPPAFTPPVRQVSVAVPRQRVARQPTKPQRSRPRVSSPPATSRAKKPPPAPVELPPAMPVVASAMPEVRDRRRALVIGGAECVWADVRALEELLGHEWDGLVIAANDVGCVWPRPLHHWVTLHPEKFKKWEEVRLKNGLPAGYDTWSRKGRGGPRQVQPWAGGSSGMLAVTVARELGCTQIVLCGVPMTRSPHFRESVVHPRGRVWTSVDSHWRSWTKAEVMDKMRDFVRSMSGRTQQLLGAPTREWLGVEVSNAEEA